MIIPPLNTPVAYTVLFENPAAPHVIKYLTPNSSEDIAQVMITSLDMDSDVKAMNELTSAVKVITDKLSCETDEIIKYNPMFLPMDPEELAIRLEVDSDGDLKAVDGFTSPFISASLRWANDERPDMIDAKVVFSPFTLPSVRNLIEDTVLLC